MRIAEDTKPKFLTPYSNYCQITAERNRLQPIEFYISHGYLVGDSATGYMIDGFRRMETAKGPQLLSGLPGTRTQMWREIQMQLQEKTVLMTPRLDTAMRERIKDFKVDGLPGELTQVMLKAYAKYSMMRQEAKQKMATSLRSI